MDGLGNINWWGFSPSIDLLEQLDKLEKSESIELSEELNILMVSSGDPRHILHTLAHKNKWKKRKKLNIYVYESRLELYARYLILLSLAIESPKKRGIQEKTELFAEIFGNLLVRDQTLNYIKSISNDMIKFITDYENKSNKNLDLFDLSMLKFKERDFLECIFKFWRLNMNNSTKDYFPAEKCWDLRLRNHLGTRFDSRLNAFDWDFAMKLCDRGSKIIHNKIYSNWRSNGIAFEFRDGNYICPNLTLSSTTVFNDPKSLDKSIRRGYFGDTIVGPFLCYGLETLDKKLLETSNDQHKFTSVDVTQANLSSYMTSIIAQKGYDDIESGFKIVELNESDETSPREDLNNDDYLHFDDVKIVFLPLTTMTQDIQSKAKYEGLFDAVYFSNCGTATFNSSLKKTLKENALVLFETARFVLELSNEQINEFSKKLVQMAKENNFRNFSGDNYENELSKEKQSVEENAQPLKIQIERHNYYRFINSNFKN